ncbi:Bug family tripartite tricarboxylate transporter substrate binding protein [Siccirubricoccus phaeus]|uniref:Bug family tripartite tricarboxylate transporter substrate binding protein n=1 Tax=Siccirubricoccus phaeus TaxID=2595053 RepID=UPI00165A8C64|nr:tripartite tricarboxylate transporter substrate binding protein [Siccirubricoccus phaeus]
MRRRVLLLSALALAAPAVARAEAWPSRPIRLIVPFPPGGGVDLTARLLAEPLGQALGQTIVIENRGGAGGVIGVEAMSRAAPDGYTFSLDGAGTITAGPHLRRLSYDAMGLAHVSLLVRMPFILAVRNTLPARSLAEFLKLPELRWASGGIGTSQHLTGELFRQMSGMAMTHIPYRGTGPALNDLAAGIVDAYFGDPATLGVIRGGQARAMAVTSPARWPLLPEVPAVAEALPGYASENWYGLAGPAGTPPEIVARLNGLIRDILANPATAKRFDEAGLHPAPMSLAEYRAFLERNSATWARVVQAGNIRVDSD